MYSCLKGEAMPSRENEQLDRVRHRFTRTAQRFAAFALTKRREEAVLLARLANLRGDEVALDVACGPGTFIGTFAARTRFLTGVDLTPAMLEQARRTARDTGLANVAFTRADANALPFGDQSIGLVICGYGLHHFLGPARVVNELGRVMGRGGQLAAIDLIVPAGGDQEANNRIERARDNSHATTLTAAEIQALIETAGLRIVRSEIHERPRQFEDWMQIAGWSPKTPAYDETFRLMEASIPGDIAGFHPRLTAGAEGAGQRRLEFVQTSLFVVGEKL